MNALELKRRDGLIQTIKIEPIQNYVSGTTVGNWDDILEKTADVDLETIEEYLDKNYRDKDLVGTFVLLVLDALNGGERLFNEFVNWKYEVSEINDDNLKTRILDIIETSLKTKEDGYSLAEFYELFGDRCSPLTQKAFLRESDRTDPYPESNLQRVLEQRARELEEDIKELVKKQQLLQLHVKAESGDPAALMSLVPVFEEEGEKDNAVECLCKSASGGMPEAGEELAQRLYQEKSYFAARYWFKKIDSKSKEYAKIRFFGLDGAVPERTEECFERIYPVLEAERLYKESYYEEAYKILDSLKELDNDPIGKYMFLYADLVLNKQDRIESDNPEKAFDFLKKSADLGYEPALALLKQYE